MRFKDIFEAPITSWEIDPDMESNEQKMLQKFHGYERERKHWPGQDKKLIRDSSNIQRIKSSFIKVPYNFNIYLYQYTEPDYDKILSIGLISYEELTWIFGEDESGKIVRHFNSLKYANSINILLTNNITDKNYVPLRSAWMVLHRIGHALIPQNYSILARFEFFVRKILRELYHIKWKNTHSMIDEDNLTGFGVELAKILGTTNAARNMLYTSYYEWVIDTFSEYLLKGDIAFNKLPDVWDLSGEYGNEYIATKRNAEKEEVIKERFKRELKKEYDNLLKESQNQIILA